MTHAEARGRLFLRYLAARPRSRGLLYSEYLDLGLDRRDDARDFLGAYGAARLALRINRVSNRRGLVADKLLGDATLCGAGLPVPDLVAVFGRPTPIGVTRIGSERDLRALFAQAPLPLFGKPALAQRSDDAISVAAYDAAGDAVAGCTGAVVPLGAVWRQLAHRHAGSGFVFQRHIAQHPALARVCGAAVATVRLITLFADGRTHLYRAFWKIPTGDAVADNFWRGNLMAPVDIATGRVGAARGALRFDAPAIARHPDSDAPIEGLELPDWDAVCRTVRKAAGLYHVLPLLGWDVAIAKTGPVIVEANTSPSLELPQYLTGTGALAGDEGARLRHLAQDAQVRTAARKRARRARRRDLLRKRFGRD